MGSPWDSQSTPETPQHHQKNHRNPRIIPKELQPLPRNNNNMRVDNSHAMPQIWADAPMPLPMLCQLPAHAMPMPCPCHAHAEPHLWTWGYWGRAGNLTLSPMPCSCTPQIWAGNPKQTQQKSHSYAMSVKVKLPPDFFGIFFSGIGWHDPPTGKARNVKLKGCGLPTKQVGLVGPSPWCFNKGHYQLGP